MVVQSMNSVSVTTHSPEETRKVGEIVGRLVFPGALLGLQGDLGAGKTVFVQGLAHGMGVRPEEYVRSPTFTIINEYDTTPRLYHIDLYRVEGLDELEALGYEEVFYGSGVCAVEWIDRVPEAVPSEYLEIRFLLGRGEARTLEFIAHGGPYEKLVDTLRREIEG